MDKVIFFRKSNGLIIGMTTQEAGNFYPNGSSIKAIELAEKTIRLVDYPKFSNLIVMRAERHGNSVINLSSLADTVGIVEFFCDGVIYKGPGAAVFFPGGCPAIAFYDPEKNLFGLIHGGWQPMIKGIIKKFLAEWEISGGKKERTKIQFLPSICESCLIYDDPYFNSTIFPKLVELFGNKKSAKDFFTSVRKKTHFQLNFLIEHLIRRDGYNNISILPARKNCTCCGDNTYWCYRHHDNGNEKYRNAAFIIAR